MVRHFQRYAFARSECEPRYDMLYCKPTAYGREIQTLKEFVMSLLNPLFQKQNFFDLNIDLLILKMKAFSERLTGSIFKCSVQ